MNFNKIYALIFSLIFSLPINASLCLVKSKFASKAFQCRTILIKVPQQKRAHKRLVHPAIVITHPANVTFLGKIAAFVSGGSLALYNYATSNSDTLSTQDKFRSANVYRILKNIIDNNGPLGDVANNANIPDSIRKNLHAPFVQAALNDIKPLEDVAMRSLGTFKGTAQRVAAEYYPIKIASQAPQITIPNVPLKVETIAGPAVTPIDIKRTIPVIPSTTPRIHNWKPFGIFNSLKDGATVALKDSLKESVNPLSLTLNCLSAAGNGNAKSFKTFGPAFVSQFTKNLATSFTSKGISAGTICALKGAGLVAAAPGPLIIVATAVGSSYVAGTLINTGNSYIFNALQQAEYDQLAQTIAQEAASLDQALETTQNVTQAAQNILPESLPKVINEVTDGKTWNESLKEGLLELAATGEVVNQNVSSQTLPDSLAQKCANKTAQTLSQPKELIAQTLQAVASKIAKPALGMATATATVLAYQYLQTGDETHLLGDDSTTQIMPNSSATQIISGGFPVDPEDPEDEDEGSEKSEDTSHMTEEAAKKIWEQSRELSQLKQIIEELKKITSNTKPGNSERATKSATEYLNLLKHAEKLYEYFRNLPSDTSQISQNTGIPEFIIQAIKNHIFYEKHILETGTSKFSADIDMANAWLRLISNNYVQTDLKLLLHEYAEALIMQGRQIPYEKAHDIVERTFSWVTSL